MNPGLDDNTVNLFRQMMQAQDEQIRAQAAQVQQLTNLVKDLAVLGVQNTSQSATSALGTAAASSSGDPSGPAPMDVDTGIRSRRAENLHSDSTSAEFCLDEREACRDPSLECLQKRSSPVGSVCLTTVSQRNLTSQSQSAVPVQQSTLDVGKAAPVPASFGSCFVRVLSKFQRAQDLIHLIEVAQKGASAGYEFWRLLNRELSVRSRVEGQALREQMINLHPPKHLKRPLDVMRWYMTELMKFESQVGKKYPELKVHEQEAVLGVLKYLDEDAKRYLLLHQTTSGLDCNVEGLAVLRRAAPCPYLPEGATTTGTSTRLVPGRATRVTKEKARKGRRAKETKERPKETKEKARVNELTKPTRGTRRTSLERVPRHVPRARPRRLTCATTVARKGIGPATAG